MINDIVMKQMRVNANPMLPQLRDDGDYDEVIGLQTDDIANDNVYQSHDNSIDNTSGDTADNNIGNTTDNNIGNNTTIDTSDPNGNLVLMVILFWAPLI